MFKKMAIFGALAILGAVITVGVQWPPAMAEEVPPIKRIPLQKFDVPDSKYETVVAIAELAPKVLVGRHTHPGPESSYILEGELELMVDGKPPQIFKAGQVFNIPANTIHDARAGDKGAKVLATYIIEKGKPVASPAK